jgi:DNA-binding SARP family transcriptional activator
LSTAGKALTLLATLALRLRSDVPHEELLDPLWPEQDATQSTESLNSLNSTVHRRLRNGAGEGTAVIYANWSSYLNTAAGYSTDSALSDAHIAGDSLLPSAATEGGRCCSG